MSDRSLALHRLWLYLITASSCWVFGLCLYHRHEGTGKRHTGAETVAQFVVYVDLYSRRHCLLGGKIEPYDLVSP